MGKKVKFPFLFRTPELTPIPTTTSWQWPSCGTHKTLSFRASGSDIFKTIDSAYDRTEELEDFGDGGGGDSVEAVISGLRTAERLFFEPGETSSILGEYFKSNEEGHFVPEKETSGSVVVAMDSMDPYTDFKKSMEEMLEAHDELKEWDGLEELLGWYLRANGKENHGYIVGAFVDLLVGLAFAASSSCSCSSSSSSSSHDHDKDHDQSFSVITSTACSLNSPLSFSSSTTSSTSTPCLYSLDAEDEIEKTLSTHS